MNILDQTKITGNVDFTIYKNNISVCNFNTHNNVTSEGVNNLLQTLCLKRTSFIYGIGIKYINPSTSLEEEAIYTQFSSAKVVAGSTPYVEFRFYLPSDRLNGMSLMGATLKTRDSANNIINFAEVTTTDKTITNNTVLTEGTIAKTADITVLYVWRIAIVGQFVDVVY